MTRTDKYRNLRESIKLEVAKEDRELCEYDFKLADAEVLKRLSKMKGKIK